MHIVEASHGRPEVSANSLIRVHMSPQTRKRASSFIPLLFRNCFSVLNILKLLLTWLNYSFDCRTVYTGITCGVSFSVRAQHRCLRSHDRKSSSSPTLIKHSILGPRHKIKSSIIWLSVSKVVLKHLSGSSQGTPMPSSARDCKGVQIQEKERPHS